MSNLANLDNVVVFNNVKLSFVHFDKPGEFQGKYSYSCHLIMPPDHEGYLKFHKIKEQLAAAYCTIPAPNVVLKQIDEEKNRRCYRKVNEEKNRETDEVRVGYEGMVRIEAKNHTDQNGDPKDRPSIVINDGNGVRFAKGDIEYMQHVGKFYAGCMANVAVKVYWQEEKKKQVKDGSWISISHGIRCNLLSVQFFKDAPRLGGDGLNIDTTSYFKPIGNVETEMPSAPSFLMKDLSNGG